MNNAIQTGANKQRSYSGDYMSRGKEAEAIVMEFLQARPGVVGIEDFRNLRPVQQADIDCAILMLDGTVPLVEIKSDSHLGVTGNVLFEVLRINHTCRPEYSCTLGWTARSPATYFAYYASSVKRIYICRSDELRKAFQTYTQSARSNAKVSWVNTDNIKSTVNILIPWSYCESAFRIYDLDTYTDSRRSYGQRTIDS